MVDCARCGVEIAAGQEVVKKGFLDKKSYHKECVPTEREKEHTMILAGDVCHGNECLPHL